MLLTRRDAGKRRSIRLRGYLRRALSSNGVATQRKTIRIRRWQAVMAVTSIADCQEILQVAKK